MPTLSTYTLATIFGILGNVVAVGVFLSPMPTFYKICMRKSSDGYKSLPYAVALFSAMMLLYYGSLKPGGFLLITINSFGCFIEVIYLGIFVVYAPKEKRNSTLKLILAFNVVGCSLVMVLTSLLSKGTKRIIIVGWINAAINLAVFAAPLSVMRQVIKTRSVEFMPITLSLALTLNATMWFFYGFFLKDYFIAGPNIIGFTLGIFQMILYIVYRWCNTKTQEEPPTHEETNTDVTLETIIEDGKQIELQIA